jgi:hypothetical protein
MKCDVAVRILGQWAWDVKSSDGPVGERGWSEMW